MEARAALNNYSAGVILELIDAGVFTRSTDAGARVPTTLSSILQDDIFFNVAIKASMALTAALALFKVSVTSLRVSSKGPTTASMAFSSIAKI